jgi:transposase
MWTKAHRGAHRQVGAGLPSDLTDGQMARLEPLVPVAETGGRPRRTDMRTAMNAIFYLLPTGCPWYLQRGPFPPRSTVYNIFRKFKSVGVWDRIWEKLLVARASKSAARPAPQRRSSIASR